MKKKYITLFLTLLLGTAVSAQTLSQARTLYSQGKYEEAKPVFRKYVKSSPSNGNYNLWYGVCCLKTGEEEEAVKYLETAVKKRVASGQLYLTQAYNATYRYEEAVKCAEKYLNEIKRRKRPAEEAEQLLEEARKRLRMLKGVEQVCVIDSFVVNKKDFLEAYKLSPEAGKLATNREYFKNASLAGGTAYETELGNKVYYSELQADSTWSILSSNKLLDGWSKGRLLPGEINGKANANYPYALSDGITIYYASDGDESIGGYDIFVTRYNTAADTYLAPENVGMPFNSPYNDYMFVIDEFYNLGWFASDRYQPEEKVCIYVFVPNATKRVYNYENADKNTLKRLAQLHSIQETWADSSIVEAARQRLAQTAERQTSGNNRPGFAFIIDDNHTYHQLTDFRSSEAKALYGQYAQLQKSCQGQQEKLEAMRRQYTRSNREGKDNLSAAILDLEKHVRQLSEETRQMEIKVRNAEKQTLKD